MNLASAIRQTFDDLSGRFHRVSQSTFTETMHERFPDLLGKESQRLIDMQLWKALRDLTRAYADDDEQPELPGLGLPAVLLLESGGAPYIVKTEDATLPDLEVGRLLRLANVNRAQSRLDRYEAGLLKLRPLMSADPSMTVRQAATKLGVWK